jgi:hypothetical protein
MPGFSGTVSCESKIPILSGLSTVNYGLLLRSAEGEEVLRAFDGILEAAQELLQIVAALDEINLRRVNHQEVGGGVTEEEMFVGARHFLNVFEGDLRLITSSFLGDARAQDFGLGLQVDDEVRRGQICSKKFVVALVKLEFVVVEIEIRKDAVFFEEKIGKEESGSFDCQAFAKVLLALDEEVHLGPKGRAGFGFVEVGEEGIVFAVEDSASVEAFGKDARESALTNAQRPFDGNEAGRLRAALWNERTLGGRGVVAGHSWTRPNLIEATREL